MLLKLFVLGLISVTASFASAESKFSNCLEMSPSRNLIVTWENGDFYQRDILYTETSISCRYFEDLKKLPNQTNPAVYSFLSGVRWTLLGWSEQDKNFIGHLPLTQRQHDLLTQIHLGATEPRDEMNAADFLKNHPIPEYTFKTNEELTAKYGIGFSGEVYEAWIAAQAPNQKAKDLFISHMQQAQPAHNSNVLVLVSMGLGWESNTALYTDKTAFWVQDFAREIQATGFDSILLQRPSMGQVRDNVAVLKPQIQKAFEQGKDIILSGLCKGVPEMLLAWTEVEQEALQNYGSRPAQWGHVIGVLNISGMNTGVFVADYMQNTLLGKIIKRAAPFLPLAAENKSEYPKALSSMTTPKSNNYDAEYIPRLPKDIPYLNVVGVLPGNGLLPTDRLLMNDFLQVNEKFKIVRAANDGFLEHPGIALPASILPLDFTLTFHSSHMLMDGTIGDYDMKTSDVRIATYRAFYQTLLDLSQQGSRP